LIRRDSQEIEAEYKNEVSEGNFDIPLNDISLRAYMECHPQAALTKKWLTSNGFNIEEAPTSDATFKQMARLLQAVGITSLSDFDHALREDLPNAAEYMNHEANITPVLLITATLTVARGIKDKEAFKGVYNEEGWKKIRALSRRIS
jgi:hypothetical protein